MGAALNPCVRLVACRTEPTKDFRKARAAFWSSPLTSQVEVPETCDANVTQTGGYSQTPAITCPAYACATWCNPWTSQMAACVSCPVNSIVASAAYCSGWCNAYTCSLQMCAGCTTCDTLRDGGYCAGWCNKWTCWTGA